MPGVDEETAAAGSSGQLRSTSVTPHLVIAACTHDHVILENRTGHGKKTDGAEARQDVFHVPSKAGRLGDRKKIRLAIRKQAK